MGHPPSRKIAKQVVVERFFSQPSFLRTPRPWFWTLLALALLIHPAGLSVQKRFWVPSDLQLTPPAVVLELVATPAQTHQVNDLLAAAPSFGPPPDAILAGHIQPKKPVSSQNAAILPVSISHPEPSAPRPPPA